MGYLCFFVISWIFHIFSRALAFINFHTSPTYISKFGHFAYIKRLLWKLEHETFFSHRTTSYDMETFYRIKTNLQIPTVITDTRVKIWQCGFFYRLQLSFLYPSIYFSKCRNIPWLQTLHATIPTLKKGLFKNLHFSTFPKKIWKRFKC